MTKKLEGIIPAVITPLEENGKIDFKLLEKQVSYLSSAGAHGFFVNGSTGEGPYLTIREKIEAFKLVKEVAEGRQFLCAACLQPSTSLVLEEIKAYEKLEPDFIAAVTPYYYSVSQKVIKAHYQQIAKSSHCPVIIYNIPQNTHNTIELDTILELALSHDFVGTKDSSGDFIRFARAMYREGRPSDFSWIQGEDLLDAPSLFVGANGLVTGLGNVWIDPYIELYREKKQGNLEKLNEVQKKINKLYKVITVTGGKIIPAIKAGAMLLGRSTHWMKIAGLTLNEHEISKVREVLVNLGLLE